MKQLIIVLLTSSLTMAQSVHQFENELHKKLLKPRSGSVHNIVQSKTSLSSQLNKTVFGYLPWWEYAAGYHQYVQYNLISHIAVFSFEADGSGNLTNPFGWPWNDVIESAHSNGVKVIMTVTSFNGEDIHKLMTDIGIRNKLFENIRLKMLASGLDGVNIDFENLRDENDKKYASVAFMNHLKEYFRFNPLYEISFATPSYGYNQWNFAGLAEQCNYLFVMNYDYWGSWANTTGPSAPLTGQFISVTNSIADEYKDVPASKIILGVPYYGNYWKTNSSLAYATVKPFNSDSTNNNWQKIVLYREVISDYSLYEKLWDDVSNTPWIRWNNNGWNQVWYDDSTSLELKYNLAMNRNLKGIGIWALGYDGNRRELWSLIRKKFVNPTSVNNDLEIPRDIILYQNYPNPFNPTTKIKYSIPETGLVVIKVYDMLGKEIVTLVNEKQLSGHHEVDFDGSRLPSGIYFYSINYNKHLLTGKMTLVK
jgi:spore germination protein YaaH